VPPFHGLTFSARQTSFGATGSQASSRPKGALLGGSALANMARFQPRLLCGSSGVAPLNFQSLLSSRVTGTFCTGMYTRPVAGLNDIECQLRAP
jgi:hypothetical protein